MKTLFILLYTLLFVYPWQESPTPKDQPLARGMYTYTGRYVSSNGTISDMGMCSVFFVNIYENQLVVTRQSTGSLEFVDTSYPYVGNDNQGNRVYRLNDSDKFLVDGNYDIEHVMSYTLYNGNVTVDTRYEVEKGDHSQECLEKLRGRLYETPFL